MSLDDQIEIFQNNMFNYINYNTILIYSSLIIIKKLIITVFFQ
jgi:hypothetical protein